MTLRVEESRTSENQISEDRLWSTEYTPRAKDDVLQVLFANGFLPKVLPHRMVLTMFSQALVVKPPAILQPRLSLLILWLLLTRPGFLILGLLMLVKATTHVLLEELLGLLDTSTGQGSSGQPYNCECSQSKARGQDRKTTNANISSKFA